MWKLQSLVLGCLMIVFSVVSLPSWACDALGANRHIGVVTEINTDAETFTIIDAQRQKPVTFTASRKILETVELERTFIVTCRIDDRHRMKAEFVVPAPSSPIG